jgi:hypothetical protein
MDEIPFGEQHSEHLEELLDTLVEFLRDYVVMSTAQADAPALWAGAYARARRARDDAVPRSDLAREAVWEDTHARRSRARGR